MKDTAFPGRSAVKIRESREARWYSWRESFSWHGILGSAARPEVTVGVMGDALRIYGRHDDRTVAQMRRCLEVGSAIRGVLCADGHLGYAHPIGGVVAYEEHVSISGVGFDIACGNMAVRLDVTYAELAPHAALVLDEIVDKVSFGLGRTNAERVDHALFDSDLWLAAGVQHLKDMARQQLGTVGSGNHYVDLFEDEEGFVWVGVHFGSRGLGHKITTKHLALVGAKDGMEVAPALTRTQK
jgi:tRNA-splicing ligase RtcB